MKIGINTINDNANYGNRLQNYALQEILKQAGHEVSTLKNYYRREGSDEKHSLLILINKIKNKIYRHLNGLDKINMVRYKKFIEFNNKYINEYDFEIYNNSNFIYNIKDIDCFVIGSDQVWNYTFPRFSELDFIPYSDKPKISYAASFGVSSIPDDFKNMYSMGLSNLDYISVREFVGKQIVEGLTDKKATVVLDPTLMLSREKWLDLVKNNHKYNEKYILTYFLDKPLDNNREYIEQYAKNKDLEIKNLGDITDKELWVADPAEFVNLFSQAEAVFTDSFHACVFSIIFDKYFEVFERNTTMKSMNSRIDTLFEMLGLDDRWHNNGIVKDEIDYQRVKKQLAIKQSESMKFLTESLAAVENKAQ